MSKVVFNDSVKILHKNRSAQHFLKDPSSPQFEYLRDLVADNIVDRVLDIAKDFPTVLDLGCNTGNVLGKLVENGSSDNNEYPGGITRLIQIDSSCEMIRAATERSSSLKHHLTVEAHTSPLQSVHCKNNSIDMVLSNLSLHWSNDLKGTIREATRCLKPDGVFLGAMFGGESLFELRSALAIAEQEPEGGISSHVSPMLPVADACGLLTDAGLTLTTVDTATIEVDFENAFSCMEHLNGMGESNGLIQRRPIVSRETLLAAASIYSSMFGTADGRVPLSFQIVYMIGWKPHSTQPLPMKRGSHQASFGSLSQHIQPTKSKGV